MSDFNVYCPLEGFEKAGDENPMRIGGIVSTDDLDADGERLIQQGLDFSYFLDRGWFNDNHSKQTAGIRGYPTGAKLVRKGSRLPNGKIAESNGWWAEGYLLNDDDGRALWGKIKALENTPRKLGFSIEGKVGSRDSLDPTVVKAAKVMHVAITHCPVNFKTELGSLAKALMAGGSIASPGASPGEGFPLRAESMDRGPADQGAFDDDPTTTPWPHETSSDDGDDEIIGKGEDFVIEPMTEIEYALSWADAMSAIDPTPPGGFTRDEARAIVKSERPDLSDAQVERILNQAGAAR